MIYKSLDKDDLVDLLLLNFLIFLQFIKLIEIFDLLDTYCKKFINEMNLSKMLRPIHF